MEHSTPRSRQTWCRTKYRPTSGCSVPRSRRERPEPEATVMLVGGGHDRQDLARCSLGKLDTVCLGEWTANEAVHPRHRRRREGEDAAPRDAAVADDAAGLRRVASEHILAPTVRATSEVRQVAGQPEQLELEREAETIELRPRPRRAGGLVQEIEEAGQGQEGALVRLL